MLIGGTSFRPKRLVLLGWILCAALQQGALAAQGDETARTKALLYAALQAARQAVLELSSTSVEGFVAEIRRAMLSDVAGHRTPRESRSGAEAILDELLKKDVMGRVEVVHDSFDLAAVGIDGAAFREQADEVLSKAIDEQMRAFHNQKFEPIFEAARKAAVAEQAARLTEMVYPTPAAVDEADAEGWTPSALEALRKEIVGRVQGNIEVLFEEVEREARQTADRVIADITRQRDRQEATLSVEPPAAAVTAGQIETALHGAVERTIEESRRDAEAGTVTYGVLPSIEEKLRELAIEIEQTRWRAFLAQLAVPADEKAMRREILSDLGEHRETEASRAAFVRTALPSAERQALQSYTAKVTDAPDVAPFQARLEASLAEDREPSQTLRASIERSLTPTLMAAREAIAREQAARHFPLLVTGEWAVPEKILESIERKEQDFHTFEHVLELPGVAQGGEPAVASRLLRESENEVKGLADKLLDEGVRAWQGQEAVVESLKPVIEDELAAKPDLNVANEESLVTEYIERGQDAWDERRVRVLWTGVEEPPRNAALKYSGLFEAMREEVERLVHSFFEAQITRLESIPSTRIKPADQASAPVETHAPKATDDAPSGAPTVGQAGGGPSAGTKEQAGGSGSTLEGLRGKLVAIPLDWWRLLLLLLLLLAIGALLFIGARRLWLARRRRISTAMATKPRRSLLGWLRWPIRLWSRRVTFEVPDADQLVSALAAAGLKPHRNPSGEVVVRQGRMELVFATAGAAT